MKRKIIALTLGALAALPLVAQVKVIAELDSIEVMQGALRRISVEVVQPASDSLRWLTDPAKPGSVVQLAPGIEVNSSSPIDTTRLNSSTLQLRRTLLIQPWDSGEFIVPAIALVAGNDTFRSNELAIKVYTANVDTMTTIHDLGPSIAVDRKWFDFLPDFLVDYWWVILLGLLAAASGVAYWIIRRKGGLKQVLARPEVIVPPYEKAMLQLDSLKGRQLCERGQEKEYYTELTEILRQYLEGRFGINAMEMTTTQIKQAVRATVHDLSAPAMMNSVLEMADYVKFARMRPLPEDNVKAMSQARAFVENTKPAPEPQEGKEATK